MINKCYQYARVIWKKAGYKRKDIYCVSCVGDYFVETPKTKKEIFAHCEWCAIVDAIEN